MSGLPSRLAMLHRLPAIALAIIALGGLLATPANVGATQAEMPAVIPVDTKEGERGYAVQHEYLARLGPRLANRHDVDVVREVGFGWALIRSEIVGTPVRVSAHLSDHIGVEVVPNIARPLHGGELEPLYPDQWGLHNTGQTGGVVDSDIDGPEAWTITDGTPNVIVAVLDSGVDATHPDLASQLWLNTGEVPANGIDDDGNGYIDDTWGWDFVGGSGDNDPADESWHGTFVAGIIAAAVNSYGMAGISSESRVMALRVCSSSCSDADVIEGLAYAASNGARVANLSFGGTGAFGSSALEDAVRQAGEAGMLLVAAAGNAPLLPTHNNDLVPVYPASFSMDSVIAVAATTDTDDLSSFSHYGLSSVDLGAPGEEILSTVPLWYDPFDDHLLANGTSFATPFVSGAAALMLAINPCVTPGEIRASILATTDSVASLDGITVSGGRLNADRAVRSAPTSLESAGTATPALGGVPLTVELSGSSSCEAVGEAAHYRWTLGDGSTGTGQSINHTYTDIGIFTVTLDTSKGSLAEQDILEVVAGIDFIDDDTNPFESEIIWLSARGITLGCDANLFCPQDRVTRAQMASFLARALDLPDSTKDWFTDDSGPHEDNINRLAESGITLGCDANLFCPQDRVTRAQMASFLARALDLPDSTKDWFTDDSGPHEDNINRLAESDITLGCTITEYCPSDLITRAQMAALLYRSEQ